MLFIISFEIASCTMQCLHCYDYYASDNVIILRNDVWRCDDRI